MGRAASVSLSFLLLSASALLLSLNGCGASKIQSTVVPGKPQHIVVIFQENRTPDNLFHDPVLMAKGADIANNGINSAGQTIPLMPTSLGVDYDLDHSHKAFLAMYNGGSGAIQHSGISLGGGRANGTIGETFWLVPNCHHSAPGSCQLRAPTPQGNYPASTYVEAPPNLLFALG